MMAFDRMRSWCRLCRDGDAAMYRQISETFSWLKPKQLRDAKGRRPSDPVRPSAHARLSRNAHVIIACLRWSELLPPASQDYDERTVQVPSQTYGKLSGKCGHVWD